MQLILNNNEFEPDFMEIVNMFFPVNEEHIETIKMDYEILDNEIKSHILLQNLDLNKEYDFVENKNIYQSSKTILKHCLYKALSNYKNKELPWGCLTGIRPTKLCYDLIKKGIKKLSLVNFLRNYYSVSEDKAKLCLDIIQNQQPLEQNDHLVDFYVNIPFCTTRCSYCSFISAEIGKNECLVKPYVDALLDEIESAKQIIRDKHLIVKSVFGIHQI